jgi:hypothetical protein
MKLAELRKDIVQKRPPALEKPRTDLGLEILLAHYKVQAYLAGPMRGYPELNHPLFYKVANLLRDEAGLEVFNPASAETTPEAIAAAVKDSSKWAARDFKALCDCHALILLPGWTKSVGAIGEWYVSKLLRLPIYSWQTGDYLSRHTSDLIRSASQAGEGAGKFNITIGLELARLEPSEGAE